MAKKSEREKLINSELGDNVRGIELDKKRIPSPIIDPDSEVLGEVLKKIDHDERLKLIFEEEEANTPINTHEEEEK